MEVAVMMIRWYVSCSHDDLHPRNVNAVIVSTFYSDKKAKLFVVKDVVISWESPTLYAWNIFIE